MQGLFASLAPEKVVLGTFGVRSCVLVCAGHQLLSCALAPVISPTGSAKKCISTTWIESQQS